MYIIYDLHVNKGRARGILTLFSYMSHQPASEWLTVLRKTCTASGSDSRKWPTGSLEIDATFV